MQEGLLEVLKPYLPMLIAAIAYTASFGVMKVAVKVIRAKNSR